MAKARGQVAAPDPNRLRLIQQVPPGTPGAYVDPIFGFSWIASAKSGPRQGLNGTGGFVSVDLAPILNDAGEMTVTVPPVGSDGRNNRERFYYFTDTPDPAHPTGPRVGYKPGDEWIEVYRGVNELIASATPVSETGSAEQIALVCRDAIAVLRKTRETPAGFWNHAARDVFEHYTRCWRTVLATNFVDQATNLPTFSNSVLTSTDGLWSYQNVQAQATGPLLLVSGASNVSQLTSMVGITDGGPVDHSCYRVEATVSSFVRTVGGFPPLIKLSVVNSAGLDVAALLVSPVIGNLTSWTLRWGSGGPIYDWWPTSTGGLLNGTGQISPPYTLAIEVRERFVYFYLNGQCVSIGQRQYPRADISSTAAAPVNALLLTQGGTVAVDYVVARKTTPPLNGGVAGDYQLASPPASGGLSGQYYDVGGAGYPTNISLEFAAATALLTPLTRTDSGVVFASTAGPASPGWLPPGLGNATLVYVRWTGAIYLPLADQDVHFALPAATSGMQQALYVGRTRKGEAVATTGSWHGETAGASSVGMRSLLGSVNAWYPVVLEYIWSGFAAAHSTGFTYDVGGAGSVPGPGVLSPYGCFTQQVPAGDSHYDTIKTTIAEPFALQFKTQPRALESGQFPGVIVPRVRVGRDTDLEFTDDQAVNPQETSTAEDLATTVIAQAQGLGGNAAGNLVAEAFNFQEMGSHPFVLTESENLPATSEVSMLALQLETLVGLRSEVWQEIQADSTGQREMRDSFPLTGSLQEFDWQPGDSLRIKIRSLGVDDATPRQIIQLKRTLYPVGMGASTASFRPRPRDFQTTMRRFIRQVLTGRRAFQGQLSYIPGTTAATPNDCYAPLPTDLTLVRQVFLIVLQKSDSSAYTVFVNGGSTPVVVTKPGPVDLSNYVARNGGTEPRMVAYLSGGTGTCLYMLVTLQLIPRA